MVHILRYYYDCSILKYYYGITIEWHSDRSDNTYIYTYLYLK